MSTLVVLAGFAELGGARGPFSPVTAVGSVSTAFPTLVLQEGGNVKVTTRPQRMRAQY